MKADYGIYGPARFNLHSIWDGPLAERAISTPPSLVRRYPAAERAKIGAGTVVDWSRESWEASHEAYAAALGGDVSEEFGGSALGIARQSLRFSWKCVSGQRLADRLDHRWVEARVGRH